MAVRHSMLGLPLKGVQQPPWDQKQQECQGVLLGGSTLHLGTNNFTGYQFVSRLSSKDRLLLLSCKNGVESEELKDQLLLPASAWPFIC